MHERFAQAEFREDSMGTFYVDCTIQNAADSARSETIHKVLVDTGSEYTWAPTEVLERLGIARQKQVTFVMANGQNITRDVGFSIVRASGFFTVDEVVFGREGDLSLLGARSLEGFNARVDSHAKKLVAAGPVLAAVAKDPNRYPDGWNRVKVQDVIAHYDCQTCGDAIAEADAAFENSRMTLMRIPTALVPDVERLLKRKSA